MSWRPSRDGGVVALKPVRMPRRLPTRGGDAKRHLLVVGKRSEQRQPWARTSSVSPARGANRGRAECCRRRVRRPGVCRPGDRRRHERCRRWPNQKQNQYLNPSCQRDLTKRPARTKRDDPSDHGGDDPSKRRLPSDGRRRRGCPAIPGPAGSDARRGSHRAHRGSRPGRRAKHACAEHLRPVSARPVIDHAAVLPGVAAA